MTTIRERFKMIMEKKKLTTVTFAESIGVAQATISHILSARNKYPSTEVILKLHQRYTDINLEWLLTGEGNMNTSSPTEENDLDNHVPQNASITENYPLFNINTLTNKVPNATNSDLSIPKSNQQILENQAIHKDIHVRKITEIRIFFDDNTYEIFKPGK